MDILFDQSPDLSNAFLYLNNQLQTDPTFMMPHMASFRKEQSEMIDTCKKERCFTMHISRSGGYHVDTIMFYFFPTVIIQESRFNGQYHPTFSIMKHPLSPDMLYTMKHSQLVPEYGSIRKIIEAYEKKPVFKEISVELELEREALMEEKRQLFLVKQKLDGMKRQLLLERAEFEQEKLKQQTDLIDLDDYFKEITPTRTVAETILNN